MTLDAPGYSQTRYTLLDIDYQRKNSFLENNFYLATEDMASPAASFSPTFPLLALPGEIQNAIIVYLDFPEQYRLRLTNRYFYALIPRIPSERLLQIEKAFMRRRFFACMSCERFRPRAEFNQSMFYSKTPRRRDEQRCRECACLEGEEYEPGSRWEEYLVPFVWCLKCKKVAKAPVDTRITLCSLCYKEANKLAREQKKIRRRIEEATDVTIIQERKNRMIEEARRNKLAQERNNRRIRRSRG